ncbi:MAG: hypothetical protein QM786_08005 [Breznakibacter sp.]
MKSIVFSVLSYSSYLFGTEGQFGKVVQAVIEETSMYPVFSLGKRAVGMKSPKHARRLAAQDQC